jgi:hypothetical protein
MAYEATKKFLNTANIGKLYYLVDKETFYIEHHIVEMIHTTHGALLSDPDSNVTFYKTEKLTNYLIFAASKVSFVQLEAIFNVMKEDKEIVNAAAAKCEANIAELNRFCNSLEVKEDLKQVLNGDIVTITNQATLDVINAPDSENTAYDFDLTQRFRIIKTLCNNDKPLIHRGNMFTHNIILPQDKYMVETYCDGTLVKIDIPLRAANLIKAPESLPDEFDIFDKVSIINDTTNEKFVIINKYCDTLQSFEYKLVNARDWSKRQLQKVTTVFHSQLTHAVKESV